MHKLVLIGASTGGPGHIKKIVQKLDKNTKASFVIAQHMNSNVMESFTTELSSISKLPLHLVEDKTKIEPSSIYICKTSSKFSIQSDSIYLDSLDKETLYTPSIDALFESALGCLPQYGVTAVILTGIGDDGSKGMDLLYKKGALCIAESSESAKVYGMPKAAYEQNQNIEIMHIDNIAKYLQNV
ncbi:chemotaxis protein CheB [Sulfurimonas sp. NW9]|uniref:chemotaxis protein CheB n=1 Tax=Sulfurimonas sp. NW9 TaxID=2922728 RepID=UPI003DA886B1